MKTVKLVRAVGLLVLVVATMGLSISPILAAPSLDEVAVEAEDGLVVVPEPSRTDTIHVARIRLGFLRRSRIDGLVEVQNGFDEPVGDALVSAVWVYPDGSTETVQGTTNVRGSVHFVGKDQGPGTYALEVEKVFLEGAEFDKENSELVKQIVKLR